MRELSGAGKASRMYASISAQCITGVSYTEIYMVQWLRQSANRLPHVCLLASVFSGILASSGLSPAQKQLNIDSFEHVWKKVRDTHWDPTLGGVDWKAVHDELRPMVEKAETMEQARKVMSDMLGRLHQTH